jgi:hypothetical protein
MNKKLTADDDLVGNGLTFSEKKFMTYDNTTDQKRTKLKSATRILLKL